MKKVILNLAVTLDGFVEGPNGEIDWCSMDNEQENQAVDAHFDQFLDGIDTIFYGRVSYDMWGEHQPAENAPPAEKKLWKGVHAKRKYVFSNKPKNSSNAKYITSNIKDQVLAIKSQPGKDIWLYGGAGLVTSFMNMGLVDTFLLAIHPVVLGAGKPLFTDIKNRMDLKLKQVTKSESGVILLEYDTI